MSSRVVILVRIDDMTNPLNLWEEWLTPSDEMILCLKIVGGRRRLEEQSCRRGMDHAIVSEEIDLTVDGAHGSFNLFPLSSYDRSGFHQLDTQPPFPRMNNQQTFFTGCTSCFSIRATSLVTEKYCSWRSIGKSPEFIALVPLGGAQE